MGDLVLKGATSGQITVTPTAVAGTNTLTLPAKTGNIITSADTGTVTGTMLASATVAQSNLSTNVAGNGPAFLAYLTTPAQTINNTTYTKITLNATSFNLGSFFDTTNYRFLPTVAGYYQISTCATTSATGSAGGYQVYIYKNGTSLHAGPNIPFYSTLNPSSNVSATVYLNGSTDYVEAYVYQNSGSAKDAYFGLLYTWMTGALVRTA